MSTLGETFLVEQKINQIPLIEGFQNMWVFCCNGIFQFTATLDLYIVKHCEYTRWNIFVEQKNKPNSGFPKYVGDLLQRRAWWGQMAVWQGRCGGALRAFARLLCATSWIHMRCIRILRNNPSNMVKPKKRFHCNYQIIFSIILDMYVKLHNCS